LKVQEGCGAKKKKNKPSSSGKKDNAVAAEKKGMPRPFCGKKPLECEQEPS